jgi:magnesium transporter
VIFMQLNVIAGIGGMSEFSLMTSSIPWPISNAIFTIGLVPLAWITYLILKCYEFRSTRKKTSLQSVALRLMPCCKYREYLGSTGRPLSTK